MRVPRPRPSAFWRDRAGILTSCARAVRLRFRKGGPAPGGPYCMVAGPTPGAFHADAVETRCQNGNQGGDNGGDGEDPDDDSGFLGSDGFGDPFAGAGGPSISPLEGNLYDENVEAVVDGPGVNISGSVGADGGFIGAGVFAYQGVPGVVPDDPLDFPAYGDLNFGPCITYVMACGPVQANNGPDPGAVLNSKKQYVKAQTSNCYNGFHQTTGGEAVQSFSALALFPVANNAGDNRLALGAEVLGKFSVVAGSNAAGGIVTAGLEWFTANVTTPLFALGTAADGGAYLLCAAGAATSIHP